MLYDTVLAKVVKSQTWMKDCGRCWGCSSKCGRGGGAVELLPSLKQEANLAAFSDPRRRLVCLRYAFGARDPRIQEAQGV